MKRLFSCLLVVILLLALSSTVLAEKPGEKVTVSISVTSNPNAAFTGRIGFTFDSGVLEFVSAAATGVDTSMYPANANGYFVLNNLNGITTGEKGTITFKVKEGAASGTYSITAYATDFLDVDENEVFVSVSGGSVTIEGTTCTTHTWNSGKEITEANCVNAGVMKYTCTACGETKEETIPPTDVHVEGVPITTKPASCKEAGEEITPCSICGKTLATKTLPPLEHEAGDTVVTKEATCTETGTQVTQCKNCGKTIKSDTIPAKDHTVVVDAAVEATCTATGRTEGKHCSECKVVIVKQEVVPAKDHTVVVDAAVKATCTVTGLTEGKHCSECKAVIVKQEVVPAKDHTVVVDAAVEATCTATGLTEGKHCSECKAVIMKQEVVPVKPHEKGNAVVSEKPSCTKPGLQSYKCTVCGAEIENEEIPPVGHTEGTAERTKDPSCTEKGEEVVKCTVCGDIVKTNPVDMIDHTSDKGTVTTEPTCTVPGVKTYKCTVCGERMKTEAVAVVPHTEDEGAVTVEPNCAKEGVKTFKCSVCGKELRTDSVPVTDHIPGEWVIVKPAEGNEDGLKELYCSVCGELIETAVIPGTVWYHMTVSSIGPRFRDVSDLTNKWNMFTVVDLSVDGEQTFDLIAGDIHVVGTMTVKVADGKVTVTYSLINKEMSVKAESLSIVGGLDAITSLDELPAYNFGEEISIADQLSGDTVVLIYIKNVVHYESDVLGLKDFIDGRAYTKLVEEMMANVK